MAEIVEITFKVEEIHRISRSLSETIAWIESLVHATDDSYPINTDINTDILRRLDSKIKRKVYLGQN